MDTVTIPKTEYEELLETADIYSALESGGVDNWEGWDDAMNLLERRKNGSAE